MALYESQTFVSIPLALISTPSHHRRRSCTPISEENFDLPDLIAKGARRGFQIEISVAGLQRRNVSDTGSYATGQHITGRKFSFNASLAPESLHVEFGSDLQALNLLRRHSLEVQTLPTVRENQLAPTPQIGRTLQIPETSLFRSLQQYHFPPGNTFANSHDESARRTTAFEMGPLEVDPHNQIPRHARNSQGPRNSNASIFRRLSVFSGLSRPHRQRNPTLHKLFDNAKKVEDKIHRSVIFQKLFEYIAYVLLLAALYFILVGLPLWKGLVWWMYIFVAQRFVLTGGCAIFTGTAFL
jgi:hypothetical protein